MTDVGNNSTKPFFFKGGCPETPPCATGFSLIETVVGTALMLLVFVSIFGVFNMGIRLAGKIKAKAGATALAVERMEMVRNLPYNEVGTVGGMVSGNIPQTETIILNGIQYTRSVFVNYVDDPKDGEGVNDENGIVADYKVVRVEVAWPGSSKSTVFVSNVVPKGIETLQGGGTLKINVFDASVLPVQSAQVHIENSSANPPISTTVLTNSDGKVVFPAATTSSAYEVTVTKDGYSTAQTYTADAYNVSPNPANLTVLEGQTTEASFVIDKLSSKMVKTWEPVKDFDWNDTFDDWLKVSDYASTTASTTANGGVAVLEEESPGFYWASGYLLSEDIGGVANLVNWEEFSWNDSVLASTTVKYRVFYYNGTGYSLIPDTDLPGNSAGFEISPIDLSGLSTSTYSTLRLKAYLATEKTGITPEILDWRISWRAGPIPLANIPFNMRGQKTIGKDLNDDPIYKYSKDLSTGADGTLKIDNLEFDIYDVTVGGTVSGYDISESCPFQPVNISPGTANTTDLTLVAHSDDTLLVSVKDDLNNVVSGVTARLYGLGYNKTFTTSSCGQVFFTPLVNQNYILEVSKTGYETSSSTVDVAGQSHFEIIINKL